MSDLPSSRLVYQVDRIESDSGNYAFEWRNTSFYNLRAEVVGSSIYVFGKLRRQEGSSLANPGQVTVAVLDVVKNRWLWLVLQGPGHEGASTFLYEDGIYWYGRYAIDPNDISKMGLFRLDLVSKEFEPIPHRGVTPGYRYYATTVYFEKRQQVVVFGGQEISEGVRESSNDILVLNMPEKVWSRPKIKGRKPSPRYEHAACIYREVMYLYGGFLNDGCQDHGMYLLHLESRNSARWSQPETNANNFGSFDSFSMLPIGEMLLLCGGKTWFPRSGRSDGIYCFDTTANRFKTAESNKTCIATSKDIDSAHTAVSWDSGKAVLFLGGSTNRFRCCHLLHWAK